MGKDYERSDDGLPKGYTSSEMARIKRDSERREDEEERTARQPKDGEG
jgi:hypothetical protein